MSRANRKRRPGANRVLAALLVAGMVHSAFASPGDVTTIPAPMIGTDPPKAETRRDGDSSVSTQTGTLQYSYPITVPPGRLGNQPSLALSYSSQGALYGGIAAGWSLSVPEIRWDESKGLIPTHYMEGFKSDPMADDKFISTMAGSRPLVAVTEPTSADVYRTYRAQNDTTFARYERMKPGQAYLWRVYASDGTTYYFGDTNLVGQSDSSAVPLTRSVDPYGNTVEYQWTYNYGYGENVLSEVRYTSNPALGLPPFAKVSFSYSLASGCAPGYFPIGAALDFKTGSRRTTGAKKLNKITATAFDPATGVTLHTRQLSLVYTPDSEGCGLHHAPVRLLVGLQESAWGATAPRVDLPAVTFEYGDLEYQNASSSTQSEGWETSNIGALEHLSWGYRFQGSRPPTVEAMLLDIDGDGLQDRLTNTSVGQFCSLRWEKNTGASFQNQGDIQLPRLWWKNDLVGQGVDESCSLAGQISHFADQAVIHPGAKDSGANFAYRWLDMNADGLPDLVASFTFDPDTWDPDSHAPFVWPSCSATPTTGACPVMSQETTGIAWQCPEPGTDAAEEIACTVNPAIQTAAQAAPRTSCHNMLYKGGANTGGDNPPTDPDAAPIPYERCGGYPWMIYWNNGNGQIAQTPTIKYQPIPLESDTGDSSFGGGDVRGPGHAITDLDGDGYTDAVQRAYVLRSSGEAVDSPVWFFWKGDGSGGFTAAAADGTPYMWIVPTGLPPSASAVYRPFGPNTNNPWTVPSTSASMVDMNGDGLVDVVWQPRKSTGSGPIEAVGPAQVFFNDGASFRAGFMAADGSYNAVPTLVSPLDRLGRSSVHVFQFDAPTPFPIVGNRTELTRLTDIDGDGRMDAIYTPCTTADCSTWGSPALYFNTGDNFTPAGTAIWPEPGTHWANMSFAIEGGYIWRVESDYLDLDGDGVSEFVNTVNGTNGRSQLLTFQRIDKAHPMRLLKAIDNGRGAVTSIDYATLTDSTVVTSDTTTRRASPHSAFVVKQLTTTDLHESTPSTVKYRYEYPHWSKDDEGRWGFRGFDAVRTIASNGAGTGDGAVTLQRYDYAVDWSGRLKTSMTFPAETPSAPLSIAETTWAPYTLFGGTVTAFEAQTSRSWTCAAGQTEAQCRATPAGFTKQDSTWTPLSSTTATGGQALLYAQTVDTQQDSEAFDDGDRKTTTGYALAADASNYRLRQTVQVSAQRVAGALVDYAKSELRYPNSNYRNPDFSDLCLDSACATSTTRLTTATEYFLDGNVKSVQKPKQYASGGPKELYTYDSRGLFVDTTTNEKAQVVQTVYDYGTGVLLRTIGPNAKTCSTGCGSQLKEETRTDIDGLGRSIANWVSVDVGTAPNGYYALAKVATTAYFDAVTTLVPASIQSSSLIEFDETRWTQEKTELDGRGRPIRKISYAQGTAPADAITKYDYDANGKLVTVTVPDASVNSSAIVAFTYGYDSVGRPTSIRRPGAAPQAGIDVTYAGLVETRTEVAGAAGGSAGTSEFTKDTFGRLTTVREKLDSGAWATTTYHYDAHDNIDKITDADGLVTTLAHDFASRRTAITRGARTWSYGYDQNGNMMTEASPAPANVAALYISSTVYDDLDRPLSRTPGNRGMSTADLDTLGIGQIVYTYDQGVNGVGRLTTVKTQRSASVVPLTSTFKYDAEGNTISENRIFSFGGVPGNFTRTLTYAPGGKPRVLGYGDRASVSSGFSNSRTIYDNRGLPSKVELLLPSPAPPVQVVATQTRNVSGLVTQRTSTVGSVTLNQLWSYDAIGRVKSVQVDKPGVVGLAKQTVAYYGLDDPSTVSYSYAAPVSVTQTFGFTFDKRHQLSAVNGPLTGSYSFKTSGRFDRTTVTGAPLQGSDVKTRDVYYEYNATDPEAVSRLRKASDGASYATYEYDTVGNQIKRVYTSPAKTTTFVYDGDDQLRRASVLGGGSEDYFYDHTGARTGIVKRGSTGAVTEARYFNGGDVEIWLSPTGAVTQTYAYVSLGTPIARVSNRTAFDFEFHGLTSNLLATVDGATGAVTTAIVNGPYGEIVQSYQNTTAGPGGGPIGNHRRRFNDKYEDEVSGLSYYGVRYYDEVAMSWTQADPQYRFVPDSAWTEPRRANLYQFSLSNPVRFVDPDGRAPGTVGVAIDKAMPDFKDNLPVGQAMALNQDRAQYELLHTIETSSPLDNSAVRFGATLLCSGCVLVHDLVSAGDGPAFDLEAAVNGGGDDAAIDAAADRLSVGPGGPPAPKGTSGGPRAGKRFTPKGLAEIDARNAAQNGGSYACEVCGRPVVPAKQSQKDVTPPRNEKVRDHIHPKSKGGDGDPANGRVTCRDCNEEKGAKVE